MSRKILRIFSNPAHLWGGTGRKLVEPAMCDVVVPRLVAEPLSHSGGGLPSARFSSQSSAAAVSEPEPPLSPGCIGAETTPPNRRMVRAELMGRHTHNIRDGGAVSIWMRAGTFIARGRWNRRQFGESLGSDAAAAGFRLVEILTELQRGTYLPPSEARRRPLKCGGIPALTFRELADRCLADKRKQRGRATAGDYEDRLVHAMHFADLPAIRKRYPHARDMDRAFALDLRAWAFDQRVSRNGHPVAERRRISCNQVRNILSTVGMMLNWATRPDVNLLPANFSNPFTHELVGTRMQRDPLAPPKVPLDVRVRMVQRMDAWQLCTFALPFTLPQRPEEFAGLLVSDLIADRRELVFASRLGGDDFNKARQSFRSPYAPQLTPILRWWARGCDDGPLLLRRTAVDGRRPPKVRVRTTADLVARFEEMLARAKPGRIQAEQDRKDEFRRLLRRMGGVDPDEMATEFKMLLIEVSPEEAQGVRFYDLRGAVSTDMKRAGVDPVFRNYVSGRSLQREILAHYESQSLHKDMEGYFSAIEPLLNAIAARAGELGIR